MKRMLALLLLLMLLPVASPAEGALPAESAPHTLETRNVPVYCSGIADSRPAAERILLPEYPLYYADGAGDLPFVDLAEFVQLMNRVDAFDRTGGQAETNGDYTAAADSAAGVFTCTYIPQQSDLVIDFACGTLTWSCADTFGRDAAFSPFEIQTDRLGFLQRIYLPKLSRLGGERTVSLADYGIPMILQDGKYLLPLHTAFDFMVWMPKAPVKILCCNGKALFFGLQDSMFGYADAPSELGEIYFAAQPAERSPELAAYGYNELCLILDSFYGLKEAHRISSFRSFFRANGYEEALLSADPMEADQALCDIVNAALGDLHSRFAFPSWMSGKEADAAIEWETAFGDLVFNPLKERFSQAAMERRADTLFYAEAGNTAYIMAPMLVSRIDTDGYYALEYGEGSETVTGDIISMLPYAHAQITRENSPIENVVLDLSLCTGGDANTAACVISWFLGEGYITTANTFTGGMGVSCYRADINRDHEFTEEDSLFGKKKLFCLISPITFSSANLTAAMLKSSGAVTVLGQTSLGGSGLRTCAVSGWDTVYYMSGFRTIVSVKNASLYDADPGVVPDVYISDPDLFYDREKLAEFINSIK